MWLLERLGGPKYFAMADDLVQFNRRLLFRCLLDAGERYTVRLRRSEVSEGVRVDLLGRAKTSGALFGSSAVLGTTSSREGAMQQ